MAPSLAAFGDSANIFGKVTNKSGFIPYAGEGFATVIPSTWNPSASGYLQEFPGMLVRCVVIPTLRCCRCAACMVTPCARHRYEDNFDAINCFTVLSVPTDKSNISAYGPPEKLVESIGYLFGKQSYSGGPNEVLFVLSDFNAPGC